MITAKVLIFTTEKLLAMDHFNELTHSYNYIQFATCVSDQNGQCLQTNSLWKEVTGFTEQESLGLGWMKNVHPADIDRLLGELETFRTSKQKGVFNYRIIVNGQVKHIQKMSTPVIFNNETTHFVCIVTDVTKHKNQEEQLVKQQKLLQSLQDIQFGFLTAQNECLLFKNFLSNILNLTECAYGFMGEVEHENGKPVLKVYATSFHHEVTTYPEAIRFENMDSLFGQAIQSGIPVMVNDLSNALPNTGFPPHPELNNFLGIPFKKENEVIGLLGLANHAQDISSEMIVFLEPITATLNTLFQSLRIKREKELSDKGNTEKAQYLNVLLSSLDDIIFELNENLEFTNVWTKDMSKLFVPPEVFLGKPYHHIFPPEFIAMTEPIMKKVLDTGVTATYEYQGVGDLHNRWYNGIDSLVQLSNGEKRLLKQVRDITDIKNSQAAILKAKEEAEKAARIKSEFISVMSHEIRTPMNAIIGFINLLIEESPLPHQLPYLTNLKMSASQLLYLLNNILDYSKLDAGKMQHEKAPVSLSDLATSISNTFSQSAKEKGLTLKANIDLALAENVVTDIFRLNRVITNLVSNAIKFTDSGEVQFDIKLINKTATEASVLFSVTDTGIGISEDNLQYIFEEFTQEHASITRKYGGTGLGLAISNKLVQEFESTIHVKSEKGKGSCFSFTLNLPIATQTQQTPEEKLPTSSKLGDGTILVVEDNQINAMIVQKFIANWGGKSEHANSGAKAIEMLQGTTAYGVVLMDLQMPEMDGYETTKLIREFMPNIPIIALTADAMSETKPHVLANGMNDYIIKPFNPQELKGKLEHYLSQQNKSGQQ